MQLVPYLLVAVALVALVAFRARRPRVDHVAVQLEGAGLTRATPDARTWSLVRGGQRLTVSAPDRALLVTVDWTLASAPDDELRYTQQFVVVEGLPQPQLAPRDDATRVAAEAVTAAGRAFDGALTVSLGPETISTLAMEFQPQRIAERALALARTTEPLLAGVVDAYRMHPHLPLLTRTAALAAFGEALTASLPDLHRVPATQVPPSLDDSLPLERWQARFGDQVLSVDCSGERDAAQLTWTRGDTPTDALDDDYLTAWELDDDGRFALDDA
ncbi:MAG: hypothetical protein JWN72_2744, partial [Thermoleophilia bacterium]|nr:hypothetical protein [Thermoleophilia bacterium]